ncbi:MAG: hypothetical protein HWD58_16755 [Bacteroidota bacterium]|nr:MAG: hypothetical protein HWD58_16755 [Bacteroidota bacterium]
MKTILTLLFPFLLLWADLSVQASEFITRWNLTTSQQIQFYVGGTGPISYSWETVPAGSTGSGIINCNCVYTLSGLPTNSVIRLKLDSANL